MQFNGKTCVSLALIGLFAAFNPAVAETAKAKTTQTATKKVYDEVEFLNTFSGKSRKAILQQLGEPARKELGVKPTGADAAVAKLGKEPGAKATQPVNVEMWYYPNIVRYDSKNTYRQTELTFVNGQVRNITFFNTK